MKHVIKHDNQGFDNEYRSVSIIDYHTEYPIPEMEHVTIRLKWDGFRAQDVICGALNIESSNCDKYLKKAFNKIVCLDLERNETPIEMDKEEIEENMYSHVWVITIWGKEQRIKEYLDLYEWKVKGAIDNSGGDDDFFDYMPNFVDTFRQLCEVFGEKDRYNAMIKEYLNKEDLDNEYEFYVTEI